MRWLKGLVIGMGILILVGLTVVVVTVIKRASTPAHPETSINLPAGPATGSTSTPRFGDTSIAIPPGAVTEGVISESRRLIVRLRLPNGKTALLLIEAATGRKIGLITLDDSSQ